MGERLKAGLRDIQARHPVIGDVRGLGAMIAIELFDADNPEKPNAELVGKVVTRAREKVLILLSCGPYYNVLRILVPLTAEDELLDRGMAIIAECFDELA
ncbi:5-aminovalerate aminotransferase DavT [compost metagenome]